MTDPMILLARTRTAELRAEAHRHALVRLATCCRPSTLRRGADRAVAAVRARGRRRGATCCA